MQFIRAFRDYNSTERCNVRLNLLAYDRAEEAQHCPSLRYKAERFLLGTDQFIGFLDQRLQANKAFSGHLRN